jgi:hypothetical protein
MWVILIFPLAVYFKGMKKIREIASSFQNEWKIGKIKKKCNFEDREF